MKKFHTKWHSDCKKLLNVTKLKFFSKLYLKKFNKFN